jgi:selenium metabolism protein YedF
MAADLILLKSDVLGDADRDLGRLLIEVFLRNLAKRERLPKCIVLLNAGVRLATSGSPVIEHLRKLQELGVEIICCRTCVEYFRLEDKLAIGRTDGMVGILERLFTHEVLSL